MPTIAGLNTDVLPRNIPNTCSGIVALAKSQTDKTSFLTQLKLNTSDTSNIISGLDNFNEYIRTNTSNNLNRSFLNTSLLGSDNSIEIQNYLNKLKNETIPSLTLVKECLTEAGSYDANFERIQQQKGRTEESRLRLQRIQTPEEDVSYYEGWFPLFRPMTETMIFTLFGTGLLLLLVGLAIFLKMGGISIELQMAGGGGGGGPFDPAIFFSNNKVVIIGGIALGVGVAIGFIGGWFGKDEKK